MTEVEWLACAEPGEMIDHLNERIHAKKKGRPAARRALVRKKRLFCCAGCRLIWDSLTAEPARLAVEVAERFADGEATETERKKGEEEVGQLQSRVAAESAAHTAAFWAVWADARGLHDGGAIYFYAPAAECIAYRTAYRKGRAWEHAKVVGLARLGGLLRDIFGNPFRPITFSPAWRTDTAISLARQMYDAREFTAMPILADALQDAGCDNDDVLNHCRDAKQGHVRGCWVVDLVLDKA